jgi:hypothetical protein
MIGRLPATLEDRSVVVRLKRRRPDEAIATFRFDQTEELRQLARMAVRRATDGKIEKPTTGGRCLRLPMPPVGNGQFARGGLLNRWQRPIVSRNNQSASCCLRTSPCVLQKPGKAPGVFKGTRRIFEKLRGTPLERVEGRKSHYAEGHRQFACPV